MLQKQTISINMAQGIDTSEDSKAAPLGAYEEIENFIINDDLKLDKRFGSPKLPMTTSDSSANPLPIGSDPNSFVFTNDGQLCLQNKGAVYAWDQKELKWVFNSHFLPCQVDVKSVVASSMSYFSSDTCYTQNRICCAYFQSYVPHSQTEESVRESNDISLRFSLYDVTTGAMIAHNVLIQAGFLQPVFVLEIPKYKLLSYSSGRIFVIYQKQATGHVLREILSDGTLTAEVTLGVDGNLEVAKISASSSVGECYVVVSSTGMIAVNESGIMSGIPLVSVGNNPCAILVDDSIGANRINIFFYQPNAETNPNTFTGFFVKTIAHFSYDITPTGFVSVISMNVLYSYTPGIGIGKNGNIRSLTAVRDPRSANSVVVIFDTDDTYYCGSSKINCGKINYLTLNQTTGSVVDGPIRYSSGFNLVTKAICDDDRKTIYFAGAYAGPEQSANFVFDLFQKRNLSDEIAHPVAKWSYLASAGKRVSLGLANFCFVNGKRFVFSHEIRTKYVQDTPFEVTGPRTSSSAPLNKFVTVNGFQTATTLNFIDFAPDFELSSVELGGSTHFNCGVSASFDGKCVEENNFFLYPDSLSGFCNPDVFVFDETAQTIRTANGAAIGVTGFSPSVYGRGFVINALGKRRYFWFKMQEFPSMIPQPLTVPADFTHQVQISMGSTAEEVGIALYVALKSIYSVNPMELSLEDGSVVITLTGLPTCVFEDRFQQFNGQLSNGTYFYKAIFSAYDNSGKKHKSAPSAPLKVTGVAGKSMAISGIVAPATYRDAKKVKVEIYRTQANGFNYFKVREGWYDPSFSDSGTNLNPLIPIFNTEVGRFSILDGANDSDIITNEPLYTEGDVQENIGLSNISSLSAFKSRLIATTCDQPSHFYYAKTIEPNGPIEFTPYNFKEVSGSDRRITTSAQLDDKIILFKDKEIYIMSGDGANALGVQDNFSAPIRIASDVGSISSSVALIPSGIVFKSAMGISLLNRSLQVQYIGKPINKYNVNNIASMVCLKNDTSNRQLRLQVRGSDKCLVWDYLQNRWLIFTQYSGVSAVEWNGSYVKVDAQGGVSVESSSIWKDQGATVETFLPKLKTRWLKLKGVQDFWRVYRLSVLGELKTDHLINFKIYTDYDDVNFDSYQFNSTQISGALKNDTVFQPQIHLKTQKCQSLKLEMEVVPNAVGSERSLSLTDLTFEVGLKSGINKVKAGKKL